MKTNFITHQARPCMRLILTGVALVQVSCAEKLPAKFRDSNERQKIQSSAITEASGLAVSPTNPDFLWTINDSGGTPDLHLLNTDGTDRGKIRVTNAKNVDWEDLASFALDGKAYLLIADTGDNQATRKTCTLHIIPEPKLPINGKKLEGNVSAAWHIDFTYEGGPRDCEAVAVDSSNNNIILISKRTQPPEVYELPLRPSKKRGTPVLAKIGQTEVASPIPLPFHNQPTGLDISPDDSLAAVVTYYGVFLFPRKPDETWAEAFSHKPSPPVAHGLAQAESVAFSGDGKSLYVVSEGKHSPIKHFER